MLMGHGTGIFLAAKERKEREKTGGGISRKKAQESQELKREDLTAEYPEHAEGEFEPQMDADERR